MNVATSIPISDASELAIRADERAKCIAEIRAMNAEGNGYEWLRSSVWSKIIERSAQCLERNKGLSQ